MANITPFMQRRGDYFGFRIAVPLDLRPIIGMREIVKTLRTSDRRIAAPLALEYAAKTKRMFSRIRAGMNNSDETPDMAEWLKLFEQGGDAAQDANPNRTNYDLELELSGEVFKLSLKDVRPEDDPAEMVKAATAVASQIVQSLPIAAQIQTAATNQLAPIQTTTTNQPAPPLKAVVDQFLNEYPDKNPKGMYGKHKVALPMLAEIVGNKPVNQIIQPDIKSFFASLHRLPDNWRDILHRDKRMTITKIIEMDHPKIISKSTFDNYRSSVKTFIEYAVGEFQHIGFPTTLTVNSFKYLGNREEGEDAQRPITEDELERLFNGPEMQSLASESSQAHCYWFPHVGLFTGARVNEICQINPQTDILQDSKTGIHYFWITDKTEGDPRITKSVKTKEERKVPIHSKLIELGFLDYVEKIKATGAKLLFPQWTPTADRASGNAEDWFREFLNSTGLRDETKFSRLVGYHAFRSTLLNRASNTVPAIDAGPITGHAPDGGSGKKKSKVQRKYEGELELKNKQIILEAIDFGIELKIKPA